MSFVFIWVFLAAMVGVIASARGRIGFGWFLLALLISPLIAVIIVALLPSRRQAIDAPTDKTHARCHECREWVLKDARKCKHCGASQVAS